MAKYSTGHALGVTRLQVQALRLFAEGNTARDVARLLFDNRSDDNPAALDDKKLARNTARVLKWKREPAFVAAYREILREYALEDYGRSMQRLRLQVDDGNAWLANKAANDVLARVAPVVLGEEDKQIVVKVEGMPALGTPEEDADDGQ